MRDVILMVVWMVVSVLGAGYVTAQKHIQCDVIDTCPLEEAPCFERACVWQ